MHARTSLPSLSYHPLPVVDRLKKKVAAKAQSTVLVVVRECVRECVSMCVRRVIGIIHSLFDDKVRGMFVLKSPYHVTRVLIDDDFMARHPVCQQLFASTDAQFVSSKMPCASEGMPSVSVEATITQTTKSACTPV